MKLLLSSLLMLTVLTASPAFAKGMNKCVVGDKVIYTVKNCVDKKSQAVINKGTFSNLVITAKSKG